MRRILFMLLFTISLPFYFIGYLAFFIIGIFLIGIDDADNLRKEIKAMEQQKSKTNVKTNVNDTRE